jgi:hypothetical protein
MVPLIVNPPYTNAIMVHTQARHIDPETFARAYYEVKKVDQELAEDVIRHTMLFYPKDKDVEQPPNKHVALVSVEPHLLFHDHKLADLRRVQQWDQLRNPTHAQQPITITQDSQGRYVIPVTHQE